ncbi:MAG TPA: right-handed parallel beta-helix repeat-containing protein [Candidatus Cloacimonadota bacterium]|nr:right-handed parallel beta-helix repeat-containing protein [Candidatus Cloacimonadota bacterium]
MQRYRWIIAGLLCLMGMGLRAVTRIVDINGAGQYTSIQTAVTASSPGDTVLVYPGTYTENIRIRGNTISLFSLEAITSDSSFIASTVIDGGLISSGLRVNENVRNIKVRGFTITNCRVGILLDRYSTSVISNCVITGNQSVEGAGMIVFKCTTVLSGVRIFNNYAYKMAGGIYINGNMGDVNITFDQLNRCSIYNNTAGAGQDIVANSINNDLSIPLEMFTVANPSSFYAAAYRTSGNEFELTIDAQAFHHQEINHDLYVSPEGDDANDGLSPATALKTIRTAVYRVASDSSNPKTVHILPGTYSRTTNQQVFPIPMKSWVRVRGAGIEDTQVVGEMDPFYSNVTNNALRVFTSFYQSNASLEDLSITSAGSDNSCAIWSFEEEALQLKNLRMHDLKPYSYAVVNIRRASNILWENITVEDITTDQLGLLYNDGYITGTIRNSVFRNAASTYTSNQVWAKPLIWTSAGQSFTVENSIFTNLSMADDDAQAICFGGVSNPQSQQYYTFRNCLFSNINCNERGVLIVGHTYPEMNITNCTFAGHTGNGEALMVNGNVTISNCIFYNNRSKEIAINPMDGTGIPTTLTLENNLIRNGYSDIWPWIGCTINYSDTNITGNPLFLGGDDTNDPLYYSLSAASPCINGGTPDTEGLGLLPYDLAGSVPAVFTFST